MNTQDESAQDEAAARAREAEHQRIEVRVSALERRVKLLEIEVLGSGRINRIVEAGHEQTA